MFKKHRSCIRWYNTRKTHADVHTDKTITKYRCKIRTSWLTGQVSTLSAGNLLWHAPIVNRRPLCNGGKEKGLVPNCSYRSRFNACCPIANTPPFLSDTPTDRPIRTLALQTGHLRDTTWPIAYFPELQTKCLSHVIRLRKEHDQSLTLFVAKNDLDVISEGQIFFKSSKMCLACIAFDSRISKHSIKINLSKLLI